MKRALLSILLSIPLLSFSQIPNNGLVGWWPFNGNAHDESGNSNNGAVYPGPILGQDRFGQESSSYLFNGEGGYISIPDREDLNPTDAFTVSAWIKSLHPGFELGWGAFIVNKGGSNNFQYRIDQQGDTLQWLMGTQVTTDGVSIHPIDNWYVNTGDWLNVVSTYDGESFKQYFNGELTEIDYVSGSIMPTADNFLIGARQVDGVYEGFYDGYIDDVGFWNRALSEDEVMQVFSDESGNISTNIIEGGIDQVSVYPNPFVDNLNITNLNAVGSKQISIYKIDGSLVYRRFTTQIGSIAIPTSDLPPGCYTIEIIDDGKRISSKLIKTS